MGLIEQFKAFQVRSRKKHLSANSRSLYIALLEEFNAAFFPEEMFFENPYLQQLSGIKAASSFDVARTCLINAGLIAHKNRVYRLLEAGETAPQKSYGKTVEKSRKNDGNSDGSINVEQTEKTKTKTQDQPQPRMREEVPEKDADTGTLKILKTAQDLSKAVKQEWLEWNGTPLNMGITLELIRLETEMGTNALVELIRKAGRGDKFGTLTIQFLKACKPRKTAEKKIEPVTGYGGADYEDIPEGM